MCKARTKRKLTSILCVGDYEVGYAIQSLIGIHKNFQVWQTSCNRHGGEVSGPFINIISSSSAIKIQIRQLMQSKKIYNFNGIYNCT
jgi:hypothetical protein